MSAQEQYRPHPGGEQQAQGGADQESRQSQDAHGGKERKTTRRLAEWVSLGISALLILAVAGYLAYRAVMPTSTLMNVETRVLIDRAIQNGDLWVLPIEIENTGDQTMKDLSIGVTYTTPDGKQETVDVTVEYLSEHSTGMAYVMLPEDPRKLNVKADPQSYELD